MQGMDGARHRLVPATSTAPTARREERDSNDGSDDQRDHDPGQGIVQDALHARASTRARRSRKPKRGRDGNSRQGAIPMPR